MANQPVKFRKGVSTSLPKTPTNETIGAFLLETDTGNLYVDNSSTNRIQIKDNTKLPLSGGTLTGPINFNTDSLPQKTLQYVTGIDGFAEGGQLGWQSKEEFLAGYDIQSLINTLDVGTSDPVDDNYYIAQDVSGTDKYYKRKHSSLYNYIKSKTDTVYAPKKHNHDDNYIKLSPDGTNNLIGTDNKINSVYLPTYTSSSVGLGNVTNDKQVKGLSTGTTENHIVTWGANGYTVKDSGYTIATSVPSDAKFTDTTSTLVVGSKSTSSTNEAVTFNSIYFNLFNDTTLANSHNIVGTGATTVSSDANGKITINTPSVTYEAGTTTDLGLTKLYVDTGDNVDGTITQQRLTTLFNGVEESVNNISDSYRDLKDYVDNKFSGEDTGDATDTPIAFVTKDYVDGQYETITSKLDSNYTELTSKDEEILGMINDINGSLDISDYVRTSEKDNLEEDKLLELGYVDNPYIQKINANSIAFYQGDTVMASVHDNKIEANNINVKNTITLGDEDSGIFEILVDSTNGLIIR